MPEAMYGPMMLMSAFFGAVVLLMVMLTPTIFASVDIGSTIDTSRVDEVFTDLEWDQWEPDPGAPSPYEVTGDSVGDGWDLEGEVSVTFEPPGGTPHPLYGVLVRNVTWPIDRDTGDYWAFWQDYGWFGGQTAWAYLSLDEITAAYDSVQDYAKIQISLRYSIQVVFWTNAGILTDYLDTNNYNLSAGANWTDSLDALSPWTMLGKILTFRMPGTNFVTNALIAIPIYLTLFYMAFAIIRSVIPLLG